MFEAAAPSRQLYCNTRGASTVTDAVKNSRVTFNLKEPIIVPQECDMYVSVISAEIPMPIYTIDSNYSLTFTFRVFGGFVPLVYTITAPGTTPATNNLFVTPGNYSGDVNAAAFAGQLNGKVFVVGADTITLAVTYSPATTTNSKFTIAWTSANSNNYTLTINSPKMGINVTNQVSPVSSNDVPRLTPSYFMLASNFSTHNQNLYGYSPNVLAKIPIGAAFGQIQTYTNYTQYTSRVADTFISCVELVLLDDLNNEVNLQSFDWSATLQLDFKTKMSTSRNF